MKLIVNTITGWEEPPRARHQLSYALNNLGHTIVFVAKNKIGKPRIEFAQVKENFFLVTPYFPVDYRFRYRIPLLNEIYQFWLHRQIKKLYPDYLVINFDFTAHLLFRFFKNVIYYCNDEYIGNSKYPIGLINYYHRQVEAKLTRKADLCIATSHFHD
ncbi:MAG: hypothetical protein HC830_04420 [Bacteroidetes bacterium]|nr:hypothetical protein [Bacteroidota bacterium]